jgi:hypothetical protein
VLLLLLLLLVVAEHCAHLHSSPGSLQDSHNQHLHLHAAAYHHHHLLLLLLLVLQLLLCCPGTAQANPPLQETC